MGCLAAVACVAHFPDAPTHPDALIGHRFVSETSTVGGYAYSNSLEFFDTGLGVSGCNWTAFNDWSVSNGVLQVPARGQGWTLVSCPQGQDSKDQEFAAFLSSWPGIAMSDGGFTLTSGATRMSFVLNDEQQ
jgi:hypothetical protein